MALSLMNYSGDVVDISSEFIVNTGLVSAFTAQLVNSHIVIISIMLKSSSGINSGTWFGSAPAKYGTPVNPVRGFMYCMSPDTIGVVILRGKNIGTDANKMLYYGQALSANAESVGTLIYAVE